jgi:predicted signal transduction protein with EAL and GGDEF domain
MRSVLRADDTVARLGGDEFAVVLPGLSGVEEIERVVASILARMCEPFAYDGRVLDCRASIGASLYPVHGLQPQDLLTNADIAMYVSKGRGRGGLVVYEPGMRLKSERRAAMNRRARDALAGDEIVPFYQPKIDLAGERHIGFEALLRIQGPGGALERPQAIMTAFEDLELAPRIGERMLPACLADMRRWRDEGLDFGHVAINAAAAEFRQDDFAERVLAQLQSAGMPASCLQVEVTETVFVGRGAEHVDRALSLLHANGVSVALDDFGTGYASLTHLKSFPVSLLKIDQRFVRHVVEDEGDAAIVRAVLQLGRSLGIDVVAEGVETDAQKMALEQLGCRIAQGDLFSPPRPAAEALAWLRHRTAEAVS